MSGELPAVLLVNGTPYGASAGNVFPSVEYAQQVIADTPALAAHVCIAVALEPHPFDAVESETHDTAGVTGISGTYDKLVDEGHPAPAGSPGGTLRDPDRRSLLAVLMDGSGVYGTVEGSDHPAFGELAKAQAVADANPDAMHLSAVEIRPFDELLL